jgi:hypothetical protein
MPVPVSGQQGESILSKGVSTQPIRQGKLAEVIVSELNGRYYEQAVNGRIFIAHAIVTAPVVYTTAAGTGGPLIWNGSSKTNVSVLAVGIGITTVTTVAAALGLTGNIGQTAAPTSTTAIDSRTSGFIGGQPSNATPYRIGTVTNAGAFFLPLCDLHTGALTVDNLGMGWIDIGGAIVVPPGGWVSIAASATASTTVAQMAIVYAEVPIET